jgi:hypothetical protein
MDVTFLKAQMPLQKKFDEAGKHSYPSAFEFTSFTLPVASLKDLHFLIVKQAALGNCLLKGVVTRDLDHESRAGSTNRDAKTRWICLDIDGIENIKSAKEFLKKLGLDKYSYILQWSSSSFLKKDGVIDQSFNAHIFMQLDEDVSPHTLKWWLKAKNIECFPDSLQLTAAKMSLRWGLDITTCQNDKLLYIAPPTVLPPYEDTLPSAEARITYHPAEKPENDVIPVQVLGLNALDHEKIKAQEIKIINELRIAQGMDKKRATSFAMKGSNVEYLPNPGKVDITDIKEDRGFVYFNFNGGDSWAYYHPQDNIDYIYNFKGEPTYKTEELIPGYYREKTKLLGIEKAGGRIPVGFRGLQDGALYNGFYDTQKDHIELYGARSHQHVLLFLKEYNIELESLPTYRMLHEPQYEGPRINLENKEINLYVASTLEKNCTPDTNPTPIIDRILEHVLGKENVAHFMNWIAFIVQYKEASGTGWVWHGSQGTGKGILYNKVLQYLVGVQNAIQVRTANFEDSYNGFLEAKSLVAIDEVDIPESRREKTIAADIKNYMTEPTISIRKMYSNVYTVTNRANFLLMSNKRNPVPVEMSDRRFNIADYQPHPLQITTEEIEQIDTELNALMYQLLCYPVDRRQAQTAKMTTAKVDMQALSETSVDEIANALTQGKADVLLNYCEDPSGILDIDMKLLVGRYNELVKEVICEGRDRFTRADIAVIFKATVGKIPDTPAKFTKYLKHHGINVGLNKIDGKPARGSLVVNWKNDEDWFAKARREYGVMKTVQEPKNDSEEENKAQLH